MKQLGQIIIVAVYFLLALNSLLFDFHTCVVEQIDLCYLHLDYIPSSLTTRI